MKRLLGVCVLACVSAWAGSAPAQPFGRYAKLDGGTAYLAASSTTAAQPTGALTFEAWIRITDPVPDGGQQCRSLFGKAYQSSYWVGYCGGPSAPTLRSYVAGTGSFYDAGSLPIGTWTHIAVTADGTARKHYVNGVLVGTKTPDASPTTSTRELQIGSDANWPYRPYAEIDELRIWNVARTEAEIAGAMGAPITSPQTGLLSVFSFEGTGDDVVGTADATAAGGTVAYASSQPFGGYVHFDGGTAHLEATSTSAAQPAGALTFETWVRITQPHPPGESCRSLFGKGYVPSYWVGICNDAGGNPTLRSYTRGAGSAHTGGSVPVGVWKHLAVTSDGVTRNHYVDGLLVASWPEGGAPTTSTSPLMIGYDANWAYNPWAEMDELRIWNTARTQKQIWSTMTAPVSSSQPGLLSVFPFEGSGEDVVGSADTSPAGGTVAYVPGTSASRTFFVPVVLKNQYSSEIAFTNRGSTTATITLSYTAAQGGGSGTASSFTLAPGRQLIEPDATDFLRSLGLPLATSGTLLGTLRASFTGLSSNDAAAVTVRTGTDTTNPVGHAGLAYAGVPVERTFTSSRVALAGLAYGTATVRTNLAIQNAGAASDGDVTLRVTVYNYDGTVKTVLPDTALPPGGFRQFSSGDMGLANGFSGSAIVERVSTSGRFYAYAVQNDQTNSDGSFIPPLEPAAATALPLTAPAVVQSGSYSTELYFVNTGDGTHNLFATLVCAGCPPNASVGFELPPHRMAYFGDIVSYLRDYFAIPNPMGVGLVTLDAHPGSDTKDVVAMIRTSSVVGSQGAFGVAYPGLRGTQGSVGSAWISAMQQNGTTRSNIAFTNLGSVDANPISLRLSIYDGDTGSLVAVVDDPRLAAISANGFVQLNAFLNDLAPGVSNACVKVTRTSGSNPFLAYGVVNDGGSPGARTGDGAYVAMDVP